MKNLDHLEDRFVVETLEARESLLKSFNGDAHLYFVNAMERDRAQIAAGRVRRGITKDVINAGQGNAPRRDPLMEEIYATKEELSRKLAMAQKEKSA
jgi:hypothetical protein